MAKALRNPPPSSSVARFLDVSAATRAIAEPVEESIPPNRPGVGKALASVQDDPFGSGDAQSSQASIIKREIILTTAAEETLSELVRLYRRATGTRLSTSHVIRAMLKAVAHSIRSLEREAEGIGRQRLPSNARGHESQRERFENRLTQAFVSGMRATALFEPE